MSKRFSNAFVAKTDTHRLYIHHGGGGGGGGGSGDTTTLEPYFAVGI